MRVRRTFIGPNGEIGEGMTTIGPDDPGYDEWAGWIRPPRDPLVTRTSAAPTSPAPMPAHSAHFEDFRPVETSAPKPNYPQPLTGPGRWFTMRDTDGSLFGVLFTDDRLSLGLIATQDSSPPHFAAALDALRAAFAAGVAATDQFEHWLAQDPSPVTTGDLGPLLHHRRPADDEE